ncbi:MAG TPA: TRAP transporter small permease [Methylomirabilota bacterium]|nr:TRAP transporter small permease [Methylomirabilota bacterium]
MAASPAPGGASPPSERVTVRAHRHLKWPAFDYLERGLMVLCALLLLGFTVCEVADVLFRNLGRPWLNANEFASGLFTWGVFLGMGVAVRRDQHFRLTAVGEALSGRKRLLVETFNRLVILGVGLCMVWFGYKNYLNGFGSFLMPSVTPIAVLYAAIPVAGFLVTLFTLEELVNGLRHGFPARPRVTAPPT